MVIRINVIITEENTLWSFNKFSQPCFQEIYEGHPGEFVCWSWCLKGSKKLPRLWLQNQGRISLLHFVLKIEINKYDTSLNFLNYCEVFDLTLFYSRMISKEETKRIYKESKYKGKGDHEKLVRNNGRNWWTKLQGH